MPHKIRPIHLQGLLTAGRGGSRAAATSKTECFVIIINGYKPLTIITKLSILDVAAALDPPLTGVVWEILEIAIGENLFNRQFRFSRNKKD